MKYSRPFILILLALCALTSSVYAQVSEQKIVISLLPLKTEGNFEPVGAGEIREIFKEAFEKRAPETEIRFLQQNDPALAGIEDLQELSAEEAGRICKDTGSDILVWGHMLFEQEEKSVRVAGIIYNQLSVMAGGRFHAYLKSSGEILQGKPILQDNTSRNRSMNGSAAYKNFQLELVKETIDDLAANYYKNIRMYLDCIQK